MSTNLNDNGTKPTRVRYLVLASLCSLAFLTYFDRICISQVQEGISNDLGFNQLTAEDEAELERKGKQDDEDARNKLGKERANDRMSYVFAAFILGYALFEVPGGWLGDRFGARSVIFRVVVFWSIFTALTGSVDAIVNWFAQSPTPWLFLATMVLVRFVFGLGEAGAYPNVGRALACWFPLKDRGIAQGAIWMSCRFGGAMAPALIMVLRDAAGGWRQAFWVLGLIGVLWAIWFYNWFRDRPEENPNVNEEEIKQIHAGAGAGSIHAGDGHANVPWDRIWFSTNLWAFYLMAAMVSFSWYFNVTFLPMYLKDEFGMEFKNSGWLAGMPLLAGGLACLFGGGISDYLVIGLRSRRWGRALPGLVGFAVAGLLTLSVTLVPSPYAAIALISIACVFQDVAIPCVWAISADIGERYAGTLAGFMNCISALGGFVGMIATPKVAKYFDGDWKPVFIMNGCAYLVGSIMWLRINAAEKLVPARQSASTG